MMTDELRQKLLEQGAKIEYDNLLAQAKTLQDEAEALAQEFPTVRSDKRERPPAARMPSAQIEKRRQTMLARYGTLDPHKANRERVQDDGAK